MTDGLPPAQRALAFLAIAIAITMAVLDGAIVGVALPTIAGELGVDPAEAIWVINAYQLAVTISLLPLASLGDTFGYKRVYWWGLAVFTLSSLLCALAGSLPALVAARALQGFGAAGIMSVNIALVRFIYPSSSIGRGVGNTALVVAVSSAAGPTVAAALLSVGPWPWLFLVNVPLGAVALIVAAKTLPSTPLSGAPFDLPSALLSAATFGLLIAGIDAISRTEAALAPVLLLAGAAMAGTVLTRRQLRLPAPLFPVDLLRLPVFALSMATSICSFAAQMLIFVSLPFWFQSALGRSGVETGLLMTPWPLATGLMAPIAGRLADKVSPGRLGAAGLGLMAVGFLLLIALPRAPSSADIAWRLALCGLGFGLFQSPNNRAIITSAPPGRSGGASGMQASARLLGQSLGAALAAVLFSLAAPPEQATLALAIATGLVLAGAVTSGLRPFGRTPSR
jgi:DHA2 family multidrug resistance protein-like MFS transporter